MDVILLVCCWPYDDVTQGTALWLLHMLNCLDFIISFKILQFKNHSSVFFKHWRHILQDLASKITMWCTRLIQWKEKSGKHTGNIASCLLFKGPLCDSKYIQTYYLMKIAVSLCLLSTDNITYLLSTLKITVCLHLLSSEDSICVVIKRNESYVGNIDF